MAEGFARAYGSDVLVAGSAGLSPAFSVAALTRKVMLEKNIDLSASYPKSLEDEIGSADLVINMSGYSLPMETPAEVEEWDIHDPIGESEEIYREVRDEIERRVLQLISGMRERGPAASGVDTQRRRPGK